MYLTLYLTLRDYYAVSMPVDSVLILRHLQEMTYEEMADSLTMPIGTVKTQLFRARQLLKERLLAQHLYGQDTHETFPGEDQPRCFI